MPQRRARALVIASSIAALVVAALPASAAPVEASSGPQMQVGAPSPRAASLIAQNSGGLGGARAAMDGQGRTTVAYLLYDDAGAKAAVLTSEEGSRAWGTPQVLTAASNINSVHASLGGNVILAGSGQASPFVSIRLNGEKAWRTIPIAAASSASNSLQAVVLDDDTAVVSWTQYSSTESGYEVWAATVSPLGTVATPLRLGTSTSSTHVMASDGISSAVIFAPQSNQSAAFRLLPAGTWATEVACTCSVSSASYGGGGKYLVSDWQNASVYEPKVGVVRSLSITTGRVAMGGGKIFRAWSESTDLRGSVKMAEIDPETGQSRETKTLASYALDPKFPNAPWVRHTLASPVLTVDGQGAPTVAWTFARWQKVDSFEPKSGTRGFVVLPRADNNEYIQSDLYYSTSGGAPKQAASEDSVSPDVLVSGTGGGSVLMWTVSINSKSSLYAETTSKGEGTSCVRVPSDGGPIDLPRATLSRAKGSGPKHEVRFGSMQAIGCFEPLLKPNKDWPAQFVGSNVWVNASDPTRINGIDVAAEPGHLLFDQKRMVIQWLPGTPVSLATKGAIFYSNVLKTTLKNPFTLNIRAGKTVLNAGTDFPLPKGGSSHKIFDMPIVGKAGMALEMAVEGSSLTGTADGYTQLRVTLGYAGAVDLESIPVSRFADEGSPCRDDQLNSLVNSPTLLPSKRAPQASNGSARLQDRYLRCELVNPLEGARGYAWVVVKDGKVGAGISATMRTTNSKGFEVREIKGILPTLAIGPLVLEDVELGFTPATETQGSIWSLKASKGVKFGAGAPRNVKVTVGGSIVERDGALLPQGFTFGVEGVAIPTGGPTFIKRLLGSYDRGDSLGGEVLNLQLGWALGVPISMGPDSYDPLSMDVTLVFTSGRGDDPPKSSIQGAVSLVGVPLGQLTGEVEWAGGYPAMPSRVNLDGDISLSQFRWTWFKKLGISGNAKVLGYYDFDKSRYQFQGAVRDVSISSLGVGPHSGEMMVSSKGVALCVEVPTVGTSTGFSYLYSSKKVTTYPTKCDIGVVQIS